MAADTKLIDINRKIMDANQSIVDFNAQQIATIALIKGGLKPQKANLQQCKNNQS